MPHFCFTCAIYKLLTFNPLCFRNIILDFPHRSAHSPPPSNQAHPSLIPHWYANLFDLSLESNTILHMLRPLNISYPMPLLPYIRVLSDTAGPPRQCLRIAGDVDHFFGERVTTEDRKASSLPALGGSMKTMSAFRLFRPWRPWRRRRRSGRRRRFWFGFVWRLLRHHGGRVRVQFDADDFSGIAGCDEADGSDSQ